MQHLSGGVWVLQRKHNIFSVGEEPNKLRLIQTEEKTYLEDAEAGLPRAATGVGNSQDSLTHTGVINSRDDKPNLHLQAVQQFVYIIWQG